MQMKYLKEKRKEGEYFQVTYKSMRRQPRLLNSNFEKVPFELTAFFLFSF